MIPVGKHFKINNAIVDSRCRPRCTVSCIVYNDEVNQAHERVQALADILRSRYVFKATQPVNRLQIRSTVHNYGAPPTIPPSYIRVGAVVWAYARGQTHRQTDRQTRVIIIHFASSMIHAKCKQWAPSGNTLEIHDYLLQRGADVDIANATRHRAHYGKT